MSDVKGLLDSIEDNLKKTLEIVERQRQHIEDLEASQERIIANYELRLEAFENLQHLSAYEGHAKAANLSLADWVRTVITDAVKTKRIPVTDATYNKVVGLATGLSTSISRLCKSKSMENLIIAAIDNQKIEED